MRLVELFLALPWLYLLLAVRAFLPLSLSPLVSFGLLVTVIGLIGWAGPARLLRGVVIAARSRSFVTAAEGFGASHPHLLLHHLLPETATLLRTQATILAPQFVLAEVTLSFLGLGIAPPAPSWGNILAQLQKYHVLAAHEPLLLTPLPLLLVSYLYYRLMRREATQELLGSSK